MAVTYSGLLGQLPEANGAAAVTNGLPEQVEATAPLLGSLAATVGERPELCCSLQPQDEDCEAGWTAPLVNRMGEGIRDAVLFLVVASVAIVMCLGQGFRAVEWDTG